MSDHEWYQSHESMTEFGAVLAETGTAKELQDYYEKPWHWTDEREAWVRDQRNDMTESQLAAKWGKS